MRDAEKFERMALWAERKADEASASVDPWWLGNLRCYQNMANEYWGKHFAARRKESDR